MYMTEKEKGGFNPEISEKPIVKIDVEAFKNENLPNEVKDWMQRVETNNLQSNLMNDLSLPQTQNQNTTTTNDNVTKLPTTRTVFLTGFKASVQDAHRWLSEFLLRMIKIKKGKVTFKEE